MNVTILLGSGEHFFFHCDGQEDYTGVSATLVQYCSVFGTALQQRYYQFDNFTITIKPLYCSLKATLGLTTNTDFPLICIESEATKPIVHVNHANSYFNISGSLYIENIKFSGLNAMA